MLVYSATLKLNCTFDSVIEIIEEWLSASLKQPVHKLNLKLDGKDYRFDKESVSVLRWDADFPCLTSITYIQPDTKVSGRRWTTEIGVRQKQADGEVECSILIKTDEISTQVGTETTPTRPKFMINLLERCAPSDQTPGICIIGLDDSNLEQWSQYIQSYDRKHPVVIISPKRDGTYIIQPEDVQAQLCGLADVIRIKEAANSFQISAGLGEEYAAWLGALNIIYPRIISTGKIHTFRIKQADLELMAQATDEKDQPANALLARITHRMNIPNARRHITPELVRSHRLQAEIAEKQRQLLTSHELSDQTREYLEAFEKDNLQLNQRIKRLEQEIRLAQEDNESKDDDIANLTTQLNDKRLEIQQLIISTQHVRASVDASSIPAHIRQLFIQIWVDKATLEEQLRFIEAFFPERIVILESAWASSRESERFNHKERAFELLFKMVTEYWEAVPGEGVHNAGKRVFGYTTFAARESETVESNKNAAKARTYTYKGEQVKMMTHLRMGIKDSIEHTLRIHFHWDSEDRKIVLGHCGPHRPHK
ncbi:MAG: hypothetical protein H7Y11_04300 [Armatimonadetes bacterium]|nr:hypothetical protein [Anaerolineae bacterium]